MSRNTRKLDRLIRTIKSDSSRVSNDLATTVVDSIQWGTGSAPDVRSGTLRDSFKVEDGEVFTEVEYAPFLEFGTIYMPPRPFLLPAFDRVKRKAVSWYAQLLKN